MPNLLRIDSSASFEDSASRRLTDAFTRAWEEAGGSVVARDLHAVPLPHLPHAGLHFSDRPGVPEDLPERALQDEVIQQVFDADALVIGAPMYNYSMPSTLKAWIDYLHVPGRTAVEPDQVAPVGGKPVVVISTRGAAYDSLLEAERDHVVPALTVLLGDVMGMRVEAITLDRTLAHLIPELDPALADELSEQALARADARGRELAALLSS